MADLLKKYILALCVLSFFFSVLPTYAASVNNLSLTCSILDPETKLPKEVFARGEGMLVSLFVEGPNDGSILDVAIDKTVSISLAVSAKSVIRIPLKISQSWSFPLSQETNTGVKHFEFNQEKTITIPDYLPPIKNASVKVDVNVTDVGKGACSSSIQIL